MEGVQIQYSAAQQQQKPAAAAASVRALPGDAPAEDADLSLEDDEALSQLEATGTFEFGRGRLAENVCALRPIETLQTQHAHNPNLVKQFGELSVSFKAWRPIRGDGNCYYRAVLFAWLERSVALGNLESLLSFDAMLRPHQESPTMGGSVRVCRNILQRWVAKRKVCSTEVLLRTLLMEVADEFNKERSDRAFILCLRHLIAQYLKLHARDPVGGYNTDKGNVLTYESWAAAISGTRDIDDYCEQYVYVMNKDAADHVQHVCPRVLRTVVRICMVDRETARVNFIDYGGEGSSMAPTGGAEFVGSAAQLASTGGLQGQQPEIYLLLKPGHYDILVLREDPANALMDPYAACVAGSAARGLGERAAPGQQQPSADEAKADANLLRKHSDARWRGLVRLARDICEGFSAVVQCLEEKLVEELASKRKRLGSVDESLFEGQLTSVVDPLREALKHFQCVPESSAFAEEPEPPRGAAAGGPPGALLPRLAEFLRQGHAGSEAGAGAQLGLLQPPQAAPLGPAPTRSPRGGVGKHECCICSKPGAAAAACGCAYHAGCLAEYLQREGRASQDVTCQRHQRPLGAAFLLGLAASPASGQPPARPPGAGPGPQLRAAAGPRAAEAFEVEVRPRAAQWQASKTPPPNLLSSMACSVGPAAKRHLEAVVENELPRASMYDSTPGYGSMQLADVASTAPLLTALPSLQRIPATVRQLPQAGHVGAAFGVPCVICFGEEGVLKTLQCGYKAHVTCLKNFWSQKVVTLCRLTDIRCPAEITGCPDTLSDQDLRGVVSTADLIAAEQSVEDVDARNLQLINDLKRQNEEYRPMFQCAICLVEHEVEGCCTLPCQHRFCFESLQYHFDIIVRERRLNKLTCPAEGCGCNLLSEEAIHIFRQCLSEQTYHKLHEFLTRDNPHIHECKHPGCEERVFLDDGDDSSDLACPRGHHFCGRCSQGPHPGTSCEEWEEQMVREQREQEARKDQDEAWRAALALGWKPCPRSCNFGGGYKAAEECDHVTCECGFEFCWDCGVQRQVSLMHDNRWHKPACRYHTRPCDVSEPPLHMPNCPECKKMRPGVPCPFPKDDGYPQSYIQKRSCR